MISDLTKVSKERLSAAVVTLAYQIAETMVDPDDPTVHTEVMRIIERALAQTAPEPVCLLNPVSLSQVSRDTFRDVLAKLAPDHLDPTPAA